MLHVKLFLLLLLLFQHSLAKMVLEKKWLLSKKKINARKLSKLHKKHFWSKKVTRWYFIRTRSKKPNDQPKYSENMWRYVLLLRYASVQACNLLLQQFPLPSLSLLKKLTEDGIEPLKAANWYWCCFVAWWGLLFVVWLRFTIPRWETCWCW